MTAADIAFVITGLSMIVLASVVLVAGRPRRPGRAERQIRLAALDRAAASSVTAEDGSEEEKR